jgi:hypothetical protein
MDRHDETGGVDPTEQETPQFAWESPMRTEAQIDQDRSAFLRHAANQAPAKDPTMDLIDALMREDPEQWGRISPGMPIFREHSVYEVDGGADDAGKPIKSLVVVPKGERAPANGVCIHTVDKARLQQITDQINRNFCEGGKPMKLFIGHSDPKTPQKLNPEIVGYGRMAYMGTFGPQKIAAIKTDAFFKHGHENAAAEYPERSAEFNPRTNAITGVALLKTDPRLALGMLAYASDREVIKYGGGLMTLTPFPYEEIPMPARKPFQPHEIEFGERLLNYFGYPVETRKEKVDAADLIRYAEENNVDICTEAGMRQAVEGLKTADRRPTADPDRDDAPVDAADLIRYAEENPNVDICTDAGLRQAVAALRR